VRVLLFGASGGIGSEVRAQARTAGHELVLFARDRTRLEPLLPSETALVGDIAHADAVRSALAGVDAVLSALGPTRNSADQVRLFESFAATLVAAMEAAGVRRLVSVSGAACTLPGERKRVAARLVSGLVSLAVRHVVAAKQRELEIIAASDLDWVAPRPPRVVAGAAAGAVRVGPTATGMSITQGDLARFMVEQLSDDTFLRQAPFISN
jgi:putative NADH-flavin reductase